MQGNMEIIDIFKLYIEMREKVGKEKTDKWLSERIWQHNFSTGEVKDPKALFDFSWS